MKISERKRQKTKSYLDYYFMDKTLNMIRNMIICKYYLDVKLENFAPDCGNVYIKRTKYNDNEWHELIHIHCSDMFLNEYSNWDELSKKVYEEVEDYLKRERNK